METEWLEEQAAALVTSANSAHQAGDNQFAEYYIDKAARYLTIANRIIRLNA